MTAVAQDGSARWRDRAWWPRLWGWVSLLVVAAVVGFLVGRAIYRAVTVTPSERVVIIETSACGNSSKTSGRGVVVGPNRVLTAAHTVSGAGEVSVLPRTDEYSAVARVVAYDQRSDLALLDVHGFDGGEVEVAEVAADDLVTIHGVGLGSQRALVTERAEIRIEGVRSSERGSRFGFVLNRDIELGESGAPVFDQQDRLVGIVFGRSGETERRTFAVRAEEIEAILAMPETEWRCDPEASELVRADE